MISNLSDMMLSYPGMEAELLYPLSRAASMQAAPAGHPAPRQGTPEKAPAAGKAQIGKALVCCEDTSNLMSS